MIDRLNQLVRRVPTWPIYIAGMLPAPWLLWRGANGMLGVEPIRALEHELGQWALWFLIAGLAVTPLRRFAGLNLLKFRRALGLIAFYHVTCHLLVWIVLDVQIPGQVWADIARRPYITIGMAAFVLMIPLALTSNNWSIRRLGQRWRSLHKAVYAAAVLGAVHFVMLVKGFQIEPLIYLAIILLLLALRIIPQKRRSALRQSAG